MARTEEQKIEIECNGAAAESAADSQAVAHARQQQQQRSTQLPQPKAQICETKTAAAEGTDVTAVAATAQDTSAEIARLHAQNQQLSAKLHGGSVRFQGFFDAAAVKAATEQQQRMQT